MALNSKIEWTEASWNPITGCTKYSDGCQHCYAERLALRLQKMGVPKYKNGFEPTYHPESLHEPLSWKKPKMIFVVSMGDLFNEKILDEQIKQIFDVMNKASWHIFQVLTKRAERLLEISSKVKWTSNIWCGVTVESEKYIQRVELLRQVPATTKFLSLEPLLSDINDLNLSNIDWVIVGGESGPHARPMKASWVRNIREQCQRQNVKFFFKQWGGFNKKRNGRILDNRTWDEMPTTSNLLLQ